MTAVRTGAAARELVLLALRALTDEDARGALAVASADAAVDWPAVCRVAEAERVAPLLYQALGKQPGVPAAAASRWRDAYLGSARRNLIFRHELEGVLRSFDRAGIPVLVLKGAALAETVYSNIAVRPMGDVDLLVHRADRSRALAALAACGFAAPHVDARDDANAAFENECFMFKPGHTQTAVELHWSLFDSPYYQYALRMDWFWDTAEGVTIADTRARMLGPEAQVLHLCGHLRLHHGGGELLWLHDIAQLVTSWRARIDWSVVLERAQRFDLVLSLQDVLGRVAVDWGAPIPGAVLQRLQALHASPREARVFGWLTEPNRSVVRRLYVDLASLPSWSRRLVFAWINLFPSAAYMQQRYGIRHPLLVPFYYPYRWLRALAGAR
jgi:hypothetical protein